MGEWQPIETAPKDGTKVDIWAKCWRAYYDDFVGQRFPDCWWSRGDSMVNRPAYWVNVGDGWHATHWRPIPDPPVGEGKAS